MFAELGGFFPVCQNSKWGFIDRRGMFSIDPCFNKASSFSEGLASIEIDGRWGYIDQSGTLVINPVFDHAYPFSGGRAIVGIGSKMVYIDRIGNFIRGPMEMIIIR